jgi:hypothetical protein
VYNENNPPRREMLIESTALRNALKAVIQNYDYISFVTSEVRIPEPYECIYHHQAQLEEYAENADEPTKRDIRILLDELARKQETLRKDMKNLGEKGMISHDLLWTLFFPGCLVVGRPMMDEEQMFVVRHSILGSDRVDIFAFYIEFNGLKGDFGLRETSFELTTFKGIKSIADLDVFPLDLHPNQEELKKKLINRGRRFEELCNAKPHEKLFTYGGMIVDEGQELMVGDDDNV